MHHVTPKPLALIILDGWGHREETSHNAIAIAHKPNWNHLWAIYPHTLISGSGKCVGLPDGQMGNSEVGHLNMGAGRVVHQDLTRIDQAIADKTFFSNPILLDAIATAKKNQSALHIMGLLSPGGVHSHEHHIQSLIELIASQNFFNVYIHVFLDGRDTPPKSAEKSLNALIKKCKEMKCGQIVSIVGRYYAMDRDKRWDRIQKAYDLIVNRSGNFEADDPLTGLQNAYQRGETDEFVKPTVIHSIDNANAKLQDNDVMIFMNFRADRAREITHALIDFDFKHFARTSYPQLAQFVSLTEYDATFKISVAFPPEKLDNILAAYLSAKQLKQLRIAETEKYAHVTFFFNGGIEKAFPLEDRILIPSPKVATYDLKPEMSAYEVTDKLVEAIKSKQYDIIICNFANPDMVGHTGNLPAAVEAIETIDTCLGKIIKALEEVQGEAIITADHGNAEMMFDERTAQPHTAHTQELVPFVYFGRPAKITNTKGVLSDIAPTMLYLLGLTKPKEMTGESLLEIS